MAQLEILQCSGCGSPLPNGSLVCEYCGNKNLIQSKSNPLKISQAIAQKYIAFYAQKAKANPKDTNALYSMGLLYLNLKNYELAQRNFKDAIDQSPMDADMYYYYALSLVAGKHIRDMTAKEIERVESYLKTALGMETKCKYLVLLACVKEEYYALNQLVVRNETPNDLIAQAQNFSPNELDEITENCTFRSENAELYIDRLLGREEDDDDDLDSISDENDATEEEKEVAYNLTTEQRKQWYEYRFAPSKPGWSASSDVQYIEKSGYVGPTISRIWKFFCYFVLMLILMGFSMCSDSIRDYTFDLDKPTVQSLVEIKEKGANKTFTRKEREDMYKNLLADSLRQEEKDSTLLADFYKITYKTNEEEQTIEAVLVRKTGWGLIWTLIILSPIFWWIFRTIMVYIETASQRRNADYYNADLDRRYEEHNNLHHSRPTSRQLWLYMQDFLSNIPENDMDYYKKDPEALKGKALFLNEYEDLKEGELYKHSFIKYSLVLLEEDMVTVIRGAWRVYEESPKIGTVQSISYHDIKDVIHTAYDLSFGGIKIRLPQEQVFQFQDEDPSNKVTYSTICTSDIPTFSIALRKLHIAFKSHNKYNS